jgi:deoxyribodipyrimidine photo-lyase
VFFGLSEHYPEANERHYAFMLEGLKEVKQSLEKRGIRMVVLRRSPEMGVVPLAKKASLVVVDRGYLRIQRQWRRHVADRIGCPLIQVEGDVIVPIEETSPKEEYAAATIRPKIHKNLSRYCLPLRQAVPAGESLSLDFDSFDIDDIDMAVSKLHVDRTVPRTGSFKGGTKEARKRLEAFLEGKLDRFSERRNDPTVDYVSDLSPYLHFGQISPLYIALKASERRSPGKDAFIEELVVRRELSMNFVFYNESYDSFEAVPEWAKKSLRAHRKDRRPYTYGLEDLESAKTHDPYWNAAQQEMVVRGKMHGYMRMYWGKKIIEWSRTPEEAFQTALYLNNRYELDGRDPNGFAGVAWCFGKHDRPWGERPIFGQVRYMNDKGLKRKFDADGYVRKVALGGE